MRLRVSMRWWLALAFAVIAALTALSVSEVFLSRAETSFRARAQEIAVGAAVAASEAIKASSAGDGLVSATVAEAAKRKFPLFVFDAAGAPITPGVSEGLAYSRVPGGHAAVRAVLQGDRYIHSFDKGDTIVIGVRLRSGRARVIVAAISRPELRAELGIVRTEIVPAALIAVAVGGSAGLLVALLIAVRIRRIARAAREIADGSFPVPLRSGFPDELGDLAATVDRMQRRLGETFADLETERRLLGQLLERLHEGVVAVDRELRVTFANRAAGTLLANGRLESGAELHDRWASFSLRDFARALFEEDDRFTETRVSPDDEHTYTVKGIPPEHGSQVAVLVLTDVSEQGRRERAERDFVANAAHELRTPVTAIASAVEALGAGAKDDPSDRDRFLAVIGRQSARLGRLTRALLVLARAQTRQEAIGLEPVSLEPILEAVAADLAPNERVRIEVACPVGLRALAQPDLVEQIVSNLAGNASKHVVDGAIRLTARKLDGAMVEIAVEDTGPGIPREDQDRVFDRFYGRRLNGAEGAGLGLAIVRETVRSLGGTVELESTAGVGTTVRVHLATVGGDRG